MTQANQKSNNKKQGFATRGYLRSINDIVNDFHQPIPSRLISKKPVYRGGSKVGEVDYVCWSNYVKLLNLIAPGWNAKFEETFGKESVLVKCTLTIYAKECEITREDYGEHMFKDKGYGTPLQNAKAQAFRRCCAMHGLSVDLWDTDAN